MSPTDITSSSSRRFSWRESNRFGRGLPRYGTFGTLNWTGVSADAAAADALGNALNADADYLAKISASGDLFVEGSGLQILATRVA